MGVNVREGAVRPSQHVSRVARIGVAPAILLDPLSRGRVVAAAMKIVAELQIIEVYPAVAGGECRVNRARALIGERGRVRDIDRHVVALAELERDVLALAP